MPVNNISNVSYGLNQPTVFGAPTPIVAQRAPTANDQAQIGTLWVNTATNIVYALTSVVQGASVWTTTAGGGGAFTSLTVTPGPISLTGTTTINTAGAASTTIGTGGTGAVTIGNATGNTTVTGTLAVSSNITSNAGNIVATAGNIIATAGDLNAPAGDANINGSVVFGAAGSAVQFLNGIIITSGTGAPAGAAAQGSLYLRTDGSGTANRAYINTDGATTWTAIETAA